jgi:hypothetical protein
VSLAEIKEGVGALSVGELTELAMFVRQREDAAWDKQIDAEFAEGGRLRPLLDEWARTSAPAGSGTCRDWQDPPAFLEAFRSAADVRAKTRRRMSPRCFSLLCRSGLSYS